MNTAIGELDTVRDDQQPERGGAERRRRVPVLRQLQQAHPHRRGAARRSRRARRCAHRPRRPAGTTEVVDRRGLRRLPHRLRARSSSAGCRRATPRSSTRSPPTTMRRSTAPMRSRSMRAACCSAIRAPTASVLRYDIRRLRGARPRPARRRGSGRTRRSPRRATLGARRHGPTARSGCAGADAAVSTPTTGVGRRGPGRRGGRRGLSRRRDRRSCACPWTARGHAEVGARASACSGHPRDPIVHDGDGVRRLAAAGRRRTACCGVRRDGRSLLDYGGGGAAATSGDRRSSRATTR